MKDARVWIGALGMTAVILFSGCGSGKAVNNKANISNTSSVDQVLAAGVQNTGDETSADSAQTEAPADTGQVQDEEVAKALAAIDERKAEDEAQLENAIPNLENKEEGIDVDLTKLSSTMVYSEVYNMLVNPEEYIGKKVRMQVAFIPFHSDYNQKDYLNCLIADATACCSSGLEFVPADPAVKETLPESGTEIIVTGTFSTYEEEDDEYVSLVDASVTVA